MGKIVKHCAACDENFAEKFGYCPNCGESLQTFEMNPLMNKSAGKEDGAAQNANLDAKAGLPPSFEKSPQVRQPIAGKIKTFSSNGKSAAAAEEIKASDFETFKPEKPANETGAFAAAATTTTAGTNGNGNGNKYQTVTQNVQPSESNPYRQFDDGFRVTVIEEKNVKQRNMLLLGSLLLMMFLTLGGLVYSIFNQNLLVGAINEEALTFVPVVDEAPMEVEEQPKPKNNKDAGGGGGGGSENTEQATKGRLPNQVEKPENPLMMVKQMTNPDIVVRNETQGNIKRPPTNEQVGLPNGLTSDRLSGGRGSGGGFGEGTGTGAGNGRGTGEGNGIGSGSGNGKGTGIGNGNGPGTEGSSAPPPPPAKKPEPVGPSTGVSIISKPRANYTDAARQNQVQGTVTLRVTFTANGQIGSISPVNSLPYGLTEQAIAAAKGIKFEPAKKNGVPQTVTKQVQYSFTIY